jgi:hypothetical protein
VSRTSSRTIKRIYASAAEGVPTGKNHPKPALTKRNSGQAQGQALGQARMALSQGGFGTISSPEWHSLLVPFFAPQGTGHDTRGCCELVCSSLLVLVLVLVLELPSVKTGRRGSSGEWWPEGIHSSIKSVVQATNRSSSP